MRKQDGVKHARRIMINGLAVASSLLCILCLAFWVGSRRAAHWWYLSNRDGKEVDWPLEPRDWPSEPRDHGSGTWMHLVMPPTPLNSTAVAHDLAGFGWYFRVIGEKK